MQRRPELDDFVVFADEEAAEADTAVPVTADPAGAEASRPGRRIRVAALAVLLLAGLVIALRLAPDDNSRAALRPTASPTSAAHLNIPGYAQRVQLLRDGYAVTGTPAGIRRALTTLFGAVHDIAVRTVFHAKRHEPHGFATRTIAARVGPFRIGVGVGDTPGDTPISLPSHGVPAQSVQSSGRYATHDYSVVVWVAGPNAMSLSLLNGRPDLVRAFTA